MPSSFTFSGYMIRLMLLITTLLISYQSNAEQAPRVIVEQAAQQLTQRLITDKDKIASQEYYLEQIVDELLLPVVDHVYMAKRVLAKNWKKTSKEQKKQFIIAFKHKVIRTYAGAFKAFNGEEIKFEDARFSKTGKKASVKSAIQRMGAPAINVTYKLYYKKEKWLTYDVVIEGVSLVKSFRDQFKHSIEKNGLAKAISLLATEYKSETPTLKMAGHVWEPYISNHLPANGLAVNLVTAVFARAGYQIEMQFMPWQRVAEGLSNGDVDLSVASWHSPTRAQEALYTAPYLTNELVIVKRKLDLLNFTNNQEFKDYVSQKSYRLGVFKEFGYGEQFDEIAPLVSLNYYKYCKSMLRDVATKSTDIALIDHWTAENSLLKSKNIADHLEVIPTPLISRSLHTTISLKRNDRDIIASAFNQALKEMKDDGSYDKILTHHNYPQLAK
jgi:ABC-type transporter MlaC component/ABC-type amino acid transport substrate-binding protein